MNTEDKKNVIRQIYRRFFNEGNTGVLNEYQSDGYIHHDLSEPGIHYSQSDFIQRMQNFRHGFPGFMITIEEIIVEGDVACTRSTVFGVHAGDFMGIPATGKPIKVSSMVISRFEGGKIAEEWELWDKLSFFWQLGIDPFRVTTGEREQQEVYQY